MSLYIFWVYLNNILKFNNSFSILRGVEIFPPFFPVAADNFFLFFFITLIKIKYNFFFFLFFFPFILKKKKEKENTTLKYVQGCVLGGGGTFSFRLNLKSTGMGS